MRLSADEEDRGYCALLSEPCYDDIRVTLDGVEIKDAWTADEESGEVVRPLRDRNGQIIVANPNTDERGNLRHPGGSLDDDFIVTETLRGKVVIHAPKGFPRNRLYWIVPLWRERFHRWYVRHIKFARWNW